MIRSEGFRVPPLSIAKIASIALAARELFGVSDAKVDILSLLEFTLPPLGIHYDVLQLDELGNQHALTYPDQGLIQLRVDVYDGLCRGEGRDRFTVAHELGHVILHRDIGHARGPKPRSNHKRYEDSEWQADEFAAQFLMPANQVQSLCSVPEQVAQVFGVSNDAAHVRWRRLGNK